MDAQKFEKLCRELLDKSEDTLFKKSKEYASNEDRLANFRQPTSMTGYSPAEVCLMYQMKHIASITKIAKESSRKIYPTKELLQEKCQDMVNYTLIFYAIMCELIEESGIYSEIPDKGYLDLSKLTNPAPNQDFSGFDLTKYWEPTLLHDSGKPQCSDLPYGSQYGESCSECTNFEDEKRCRHDRNNNHYE